MSHVKLFCFFKTLAASEPVAHFAGHTYKARHACGWIQSTFPLAKGFIQ